ncbi:MAG: hypothetical protein HY814_08360 [Candidatus Riflebacteria bacterium]|nr:hypothetical protein [Candidatus Riflebacteria bacterium]
MAPKRWNVAFALFVASLMLVTAGCGEKSSVQDSDGAFKIIAKQPERIELEVFPSQIPADGASSATVIARVFNDLGLLTFSDVLLTLGLEKGPANAPGSGFIAATGNTNTHGVAQVIFTAGTVPGTVTVVVRAGRAVARIPITLVPVTPVHFQTTVSPAPTTTDAVDVTVVFTDPFFLRTGTPVALTVLDHNGDSLSSRVVPNANVAIDGTYGARVFLGPLTPEQTRTGVRGYIQTTIGAISTLTEFRLATSGSGGAGGGGNLPPTFPNSVVFTPSTLRMAVRNGSTLAIPLTAQFPSTAVGADAEFTLNPPFRSPAPNSITGYFTPCPAPLTATACESQRIRISSSGTATTTLVLTNVQASQLGAGLVLAVNVFASKVINDVEYQFAGSSPITLFAETPTLALISLAAIPPQTSVAAGGSFSVQMRARVQAQNGSFPPGVFVNFSSDQSAGVIFPTTAATDSTGTALATFSMNQVPASLLSNGLFITLRAQAVGAGSQVGLNATTSIFVSPKFGPPDHLVLSSSIRPNPTTSVIFVQGSAFPTVTQVTFDVLDINDNVARSATDRVQFVLENGGLHGGENLEPGAGASVTTGALVLNGRASTILRSGIRAGTVRLIAFIDNAIRNGRPDPGEPHSEPVTVSISGGLPAGQNLSVIPEILNIPGLLRAGIFDFITAYLADRFNNPVIAGTRVSFTSFDYFTLDSAAQVTASTQTAPAISQGTATLQSQEPRPASGFVGVQAQTNSGVDSTVLALAPDVTRTGIAYAGADGGGVYQGTFSASGFLPFGNMSWLNVGNGRTGLANGYVRALAVDPRPGMNGILYAGTELGLFRSTGSGGIWVQRSGRGRIENETPGTTADPLAFTLQVPAVTIRARTVVMDGSVRRTDFVFDTPTQLRFLRTGPAAALRVSYDYDRGIPELVPITAIAVSLNSRANQTPLADNAIVYAATLGAGVYRSTNGGFTWVPVNADLTNTNVVSLALVRMPGNVNDVVLFAGTLGGGVFKLTSGTVGAAAFRIVGEANITDAQATDLLRWLPANLNLTATHVTCMAADPDQVGGNARAFTLYAGTDVGGVFRTTSNNLFDDQAANLNWAPATRNVSFANLSNVRVTGITVEPVTKQVFACTVDDDEPENPIGGLFRSVDGGVTFFPLGSPLSGNAQPLSNSRLRSLAIAGGNLWIGGDGRQVWLSRNPTAADPATVTFTEVGRIGTLGSGTITVNPQLDNDIYDTTRVLFSGSPVVDIVPLESSTTIANGGFQTFLVTVSDPNGNPLPGNTVVCITSTPKGVVSGAGSGGSDCPVVSGSSARIAMSDTQQGGTDFTFDLTNDLATGDVATGDVGVTVKVSATVFTPTGQRLATGEDTISRTLSSQLPLGLVHGNPPTEPIADETFAITGGIGPFLPTVTAGTTLTITGTRTFTVRTGGNNTAFTLSVLDTATGQTLQRTFTVPSAL